jgi:GDPmannose 4,6-dehydratase
MGVESEVEILDLELAEYSNVEEVIRRENPDEVYNLAAQSFVGSSFTTPVFTSDVNALGVIRILEAIRRHKPEARYYQASTSEMFGKVQESPQNENTPFHPRSPYGVSKLFGHWATVNYREAWGLFTASGILFNHESPLRGEEFVTRKITKAVARQATGSDEPLKLGNLEARRDWGYAEDYVQAMWAMLQEDEPDDFVVASGQTHSVRDFVNLAYECAEIPIQWEGEGVDEKALALDTGKVLVEVDPDYFRPAEVDFLVGDAQKARDRFGWSPTVDFAGLVEMMVRRDIERARE